MTKSWLRNGRIELQNAAAYRQSQARQLGDLHERMKYLIECAKRELFNSGVGNDTWHAIFDLETEVKFYEPVNPPYGKRDLSGDD